MVLEHTSELVGARLSDPVLESRYVVEMVDESGNVLAAHPCQTQFVFRWETRLSDPSAVAAISPELLVHHWNATPLMLKLPYPIETVALRFRRDGHVDATIDPLAGTLREVIRAIPDRGFEKSPAQRRAALLEKVDALEKMLGGKSVRGASEKVRNDLRVRLDSWVVEFQDQGWNKTKVLEQVDLVATRIDARIARESP